MRRIEASVRGRAAGAALCALGVAQVVGFSSDAAWACGGTFCDAGPQAMPVDQKGENVLFAFHDDGTISAHVQIQYDGDPERFAWVVPLPNEPEVSIGSQPLFSRLLQSTVPTYGFARSGCQTVALLEGGGGLPEAEGKTVDSVVVSREVVGTFEVTLLQADSAEEIVTWLADNDYEQPANAEEYLAPYVDEGMFFAAIKLVGGAGVDEIHPIVFRYRGERAAIPLRLTGIAATDDMFVRAFFLSDGRMVPSNYRHVELNPARVDWINFADNYLELLAEGLDADAGGHGFITEYAGPASVVMAGTPLYSPAWSAQPFIDGRPSDVITILGQYGLLSCSAASCDSQHPLLLSLLDKYLPPPEGVDPEAFYSCLDCYPDHLAGLEWDGPGFGREFLERIVVPARDAQELLQDASYLTRLLTVLDAHEMTIDPLFHERSDLPAVSNQQFATWDLACSNVPSTGFTLVNGMQVALTEEMTWPDFDEDMPAVLRVEDIPEQGESDTLVDNQDDILDRLADWNAEREWPPAPELSEDSAQEDSDDALIFGEDDPSLLAGGLSGTAAGATDSAPGSDAEAASQSGGTASSDPDATQPEGRALASGGCALGTRAVGAPLSLGWFAFAGVLLAWSRRRRLG